MSRLRSLSAEMHQCIGKIRRTVHMHHKSNHPDLYKTQNRQRYTDLFSALHADGRMLLRIQMLYRFPTWNSF